MFSARLEILPDAQRRLWPALRPLKALGFVLYGGTAIALRLGHRHSVDFDFFCSDGLDEARLAAMLPFLRSAELLQAETDSWVWRVPLDEGEVRVALYGGIGFGRIGDPELTHDQVAWVASPRDLLATKLKVILQRAESKDYRDIAALLAAKLSLAEGLAAAQVLFGAHFAAAECLRALCYFGDGDLPSLGIQERRILIEAAREVGDLPPSIRRSDRLEAEGVHRARG